MHTIAKDGWRIHYNSDFSGKAILVCDPFGPRGTLRSDDEVHVEFPASLLEALVEKEVESMMSDEPGRLNRKDWY